MMLPAIPAGSKFELGDVLSPKSSASSNPVATLQFAPVLSVITGAPNASVQGSPGVTSSPTITAPITESRPQEFGEGPAGFPAPSGAGAVPGRVGETVEAGILGGDNVKILFLVGAALAVFLMTRGAGG